VSAYLQPFVNSLAKRSPEDLNEDLDASRLESALRKRLRGLDEDAAEQRLAEDREHLHRWLETQPDDHPAHRVVGYLLHPDLATHLTRPPEPPERGPQMMFDAPDGWKIRPVPFRLDLKAGKVLGSIMAIDEFSFDLLQHQREQTAHRRPPGCQETTEVSDVTFGQCRGKKYLYRMMAPAQFKRVDYVSSVPGGYVTIGLAAKEGVDFDETPLEAKLHTLRLSASA
jgi:hypothetical protein